MKHPYSRHTHVQNWHRMNHPEGIIWHFDKYSFSLSCWDLEEKIDTAWRDESSINLVSIKNENYSFKVMRHTDSVTLAFHAEGFKHPHMSYMEENTISSFVSFSLFLQEIHTFNSILGRMNLRQLEILIASSNCWYTRYSKHCKDDITKPVSFHRLPPIHTGHSFIPRFVDVFLISCNN